MAGSPFATCSNRLHHTDSRVYLLDRHSNCLPCPLEKDSCCCSGPNYLWYQRELPTSNCFSKCVESLLMPFWTLHSRKSLLAAVFKNVDDAIASELDSCVVMSPIKVLDNPATIRKPRTADMASQYAADPKARKVPSFFILTALIENTTAATVFLMTSNSDRPRQLCLFYRN